MQKHRNNLQVKHKSSATKTIESKVLWFCHFQKKIADNYILKRMQMLSSCQVNIQNRSGHSKFNQMSYNADIVVVVINIVK